MTGHLPAERSRVRAEFDALAAFEGADNPHVDDLLANVPSDCAHVIDAGCGAGYATLFLAQHCERVLAVDLSSKMLERARASSAAFDNIDFVEADLGEYRFEPSSADCIVSFAVLHHLPLLPMLAKFMRALRPGGMLILLDLRRTADPLDIVFSLAAHIVQLQKRALRPRSKEERRLWREHAAGERYASFTEIKRTCEQLMPGAQVRRHLFWRYSVVWRKPDESRDS